jgi:hypothetical protein
MTKYDSKALRDRKKSNAALKQANEEVWAVAQLLEKAIPEDARTGLIINALSYMISTQVFRQAGSPDAARNAIRMTAGFMIQNTDKMINVAKGNISDEAMASVEAVRAENTLSDVSDETLTSIDAVMLEHQRQQEKISALMEKIEPCLPGHSRMVVLMAATRLIAAMLAPAKPKTQEQMIQILPVAVRSVMRKIDEMAAARTLELLPDWSDL